MGASDERREGRTRLVAGAGLVRAECAVWNEKGRVAKAVLELAATGSVSVLWLRGDLFRELAREQGLKPDAWPIFEFVAAYSMKIRNRDERRDA